MVVAGGASRAWLYALPTLVFVLVLFVWPLLSGRPDVGESTGRCSPGTRASTSRQLRSVNNNPLFWPAVEFTLKYTVLATVLLIGLGLGLALLVQESSRWNGMLRRSFLVPSALGLASASLLFYGFYSAASGPCPILQDIGLIDDPSCSSRRTRAVLSTVFLIVWRFAGSTCC